MDVRNKPHGGGENVFPLTEDSAHFFNSANISICHETFRSNVQSVFANCFIDIC